MFLFSLNGAAVLGVLVPLVFLLPALPRVQCWMYLLFSLTPVRGGTHFFAAPKKVSKKRRFTPPTLSVHLQRYNGVARKAPFPGKLPRSWKQSLRPPVFAGFAISALTQSGYRTIREEILSKHTVLLKRTGRGPETH